MRVINSDRLKIHSIRQACAHSERVHGEGDVYSTYVILVGKPEGKRQLWRPRYGWLYDVKVSGKQLVYFGVGWVKCRWLGLVSGCREFGEIFISVRRSSCKVPVFIVRLNFHDRFSKHTHI